MAFPVVAARNSGRTTATNTTSHAITLPSGISAGDLLVVVFACDGNPTISVDTGVSGSNWNALTQGANGSIVSSNVFWKIAEGGDALTLTTSASEQSSHVSLRITGGYSVTGTSANGSSTNSNPPNHAGHDGTQDYLWIATRAGDSTVLATVAPTNFANLQSLAAAGTGGASVNTAERSINSASQDPGTFTSASEQWVSYTLAVSPVNTGHGSGSVDVTGSAEGVVPVVGAAESFVDVTGSGNGLVSGGGGGTPTPLAYGSYLWSNYVGAASYTFTGLTVGAADADRWVIAAVELNHAFSTAVTGVTIGGVAATQLYQAPTLTGPGITLSWWKALVPTGTTADVFVQCNSTWYDGAVATYHCIGEPLVFDTAHDNTYTGTTFSVTVDVAEGGAVLALVRNDGAGTLTGWSGVAADQTDETYRVYVASQDELTAETGRTVSWTGTDQSTITDYYGLAVLSVELPLVGGGGGGGGGDVAGTGAGTLDLTGFGTGAARAAGTGGGAVPLTGSGMGAARVAGAGASTVPLFGSAEGAGHTQGVGAGDLLLAGSGAGAVRASGSGSGELPLAGSGAGAVSVAGSGAGDLPLSGSGSGVSGSTTLGAGSGSLSLSGAGAGQTVVRGQGAGTLPVLGGSTGTVRVAGVGGGSLPLSGGGAGAAPVQGAGAGDLSLTGSGNGAASATGVGAGTFPLTGSAECTAPIRGTGVGQLDMAGSGAGVIGEAIDYSSGRLAFGADQPRRGTILNAALRKGGIVNTAPREGTIVNQAKREGTILNPARRGRLQELNE